MFFKNDFQVSGLFRLIIIVSFVRFLDYLLFQKVTTAISNVYYYHDRHNKCLKCRIL